MRGGDPLAINSITLLNGSVPHMRGGDPRSVDIRLSHFL